jgi:hypothetical protein
MVSPKLLEPFFTRCIKRLVLEENGLHEWDSSYGK